ncbi:MAG UNVERIFIED_CONTAM: hypothetical protein LVR18_14975 [Planctomycetaceae bacterium]
MSIPRTVRPGRHRRNRNAPWCYRPIHIDRSPCMTTKKRSGRAGDVNPPVTVCNRAASVATGTHRASPADRHRPLALHDHKKAVKASGECQSPATSAPRRHRRNRNAPGCYRPIDIDRSPCMTTKSGQGERGCQSPGNSPPPAAIAATGTHRGVTGRLTSTARLA